jgi:hypothetical protein
MYELPIFPSAENLRAIQVDQKKIGGLCCGMQKVFQTDSAVED